MDLARPLASESAYPLAENDSALPLLGIALTKSQKLTRQIEDVA